MAHPLRRLIALLLSAGVTLGLVAAAPVVASASTAAPDLISPAAAASASGNPLLQWGAVSGAARYRVEVSADPAFPTNARLFWLDTSALRAVPDKDLPLGELHWRVAVLAGSTPGTWATSSFVKTAAPAPAVTHPDDGWAFRYPLEAPVLRWLPVSAVKGYEVQVADAPDFVSVTSYATANTSFALRLPQTQGKTWWWRVRAVSSTNGVTSAWSTPRTFTVAWANGDGRPTLHLPADGATVTDIQLRWGGPGETASTVPGTPPAAGVLGSRSYQLQVSSNRDFTNNMREDVVVKGTRFSPATTYPAGAYYWRVRPIASAPTSGAGSTIQYGPWSETREFTREWALRPELLHPVGGREVLADDFRLEWRGVPLASSYVVDLSTDPNFNTGVSTCRTLHTSLTPNASSVPGFPGCAFEPTPGTLYHWRVRGVDAGPGNSVPIEGVWSLPQSFLFDETVVQLLSPLNTMTDAPVLRWEPLAGYHRYRVTLVRTDVSPTQTTVAETYATSWSPTHLVPNKVGPGTYEWFVQGLSPAGSGTPSLTPGTRGRFTWTAPVAVSSVPTGLTTTASGQLHDMPSMTWTPVQNAAYYRVYAAEGSSSTYFELTRASEKLPQAAFTYPGGNTALPTTRRDLLPPGTWNWYVAAYTDKDVFLGASSSRSFTMASLATAQRTAPAVGSITSAVPQLTWAPVRGAYEYRIWFATDENFTNLYRPQPYVTRYPSLTPADAFADNQAGRSYYWYVQVCSAPNVCGPQAQQARLADETLIGSFRKQSPPPRLLWPADAATVADHVALEWQDYFTTDGSAPGARAYRVQVARDPEFTQVVDTATVDQPFYALAPTAKQYADGTYYWRVQAVDGSNQLLTSSAPATPRRFTKTSRTPSALNSAVVAGLPTMRWSAVPNAGSYVVEVYRNQEVTFPPVNRVLTATTYYPAFTPDVALPAGDYSWRVRKVDADGNPGQWAAEEDGRLLAGARFSVGAPAVSLLTPDQGATPNSSDIMFSWQGLADAAQYRFEVSTTESFATTVESQVTVGTQWVSPKYFVDGTTYHWRVHALNSAGQVLSTSGTRRFVKNEVSLELTSSANPAASRQPVTFTATVRRAAASVPTGTVTFRSGSTVLGTASLVSGVARFTTSTLPVATHQVTAAWGGDGLSAGATSAALEQTVTPAGALYTPETPRRVMSFQAVGAKQSYTLRLANVPTGATAVALNVTAANPTSDTYVSVCPGGTPVDQCRTSSNLNPYKGRNTPNMVVVKLGPDGTVLFYNDAGTTQLIADVQGWFVEGGSGAAYAPVAPYRAMAFQKIDAGAVHTLTLKDVPAGATAVALNVTAANPTSSTYVSACPGGTPITLCKASSNLNPYRGTNTPNLVMVKLGTGGTVSFYNDQGTVQLIADVQGWYVPGSGGSTYLPVAPARQMSFQKVGEGGSYTLQLRDVPAGATAVALNVTSANHTSNTYVSACPGGTTVAVCKESSNLNPYRTRNIANMVVVKLGTGNRVTFYNDKGTSQLIADVQGWFVQ